MRKKPSYEEMSSVIDSVIKKNERRYQLKAISWMDWEDVQQTIRTHIFRKWDLWDCSKPIEPWVNVIAIHQIINIVRNNYSNYVRPCLNCPFYKGDDSCEMTKNKKVSCECYDYKKWFRTKKSAYDLRITCSMDNHFEEASAIHETFDCFSDNSLSNLRFYIENKFGKVERLILDESFIKGTSDENVIKVCKEKLGKKLSLTSLKDKKRNLKKSAADILNNLDEKVNEIYLSNKIN